MTTDFLHSMTDSDWEVLAALGTESAPALKARITTVETLSGFLESLLKDLTRNEKELNRRWKVAIEYLVRLADQNCSETGDYSLDSLLADMTEEYLHTCLWPEVPPVGREFGIDQS